MKKTSIIIALLMTLTSCMPLVKVYYGVKNPKIENKKSIIKYCKKKGMSMENLATINIDDYVSKLNGLPDVDIFNKNGDYIEYRQADSSCNAGLFSFIPELHQDSVYRLTGKTNFTDEIKKMRTLTGGQFVLSDTLDYDFYLIMYWAKFTGRLNKNHINVWEQAAYINKNAKIKVIKVNVDIQEYWGEQGIEMYKNINKKMRHKE